ncbi:hypothetical protein Tco_1394916 [Tanacetum coccineum]
MYHVNDFLCRYFLNLELLNLEVTRPAPPSPDYVPGPEEPEQAPPSPDYVPGPEHDDERFSDPEADPEEDGDEDPIDYPADGGDDGDDEMDIEEDEDDDMDIEADEEDEDDEMDIEIDEETEEEHLAPAYPVVVALPATAPSAEETEPFETDESAATPPPHPAYSSPLSPWSSSPPQIPFPLSPPPPVLTAPPPSPIRSLGYRAATIRMRAEAAASFLFTDHLHHPSYLPPLDQIAPPPLPTSASYFIPSIIITHGQSLDGGQTGVNLTTSDGISSHWSCRLGCRTLRGLRWIWVTDSWDEIVETFHGASVQYHTDQLMETEAGMSREAWGRAMDASDLAHGGTAGAEGDERVVSMIDSTAADYSDLDCCTDTTERDDSTPGTSHHTAGAGDSLTGTGDDIAGAGYWIA